MVPKAAVLGFPGVHILGPHILGLCIFGLCIFGLRILWALNPRLLLPAAFPNRPVPLHPISPMVFPVFTWTLLIFPFKIFVNPAYILIPHSLSRLIFLVTRFLTALWPLYPYICQIVPGILPCMFPKTAVEMPSVG